MKAILFCLLPVLCFGQEENVIKSVGIGVVAQQEALAIGGFVKHTWFYNGGFGGLGAEVTAIRSARPFWGLTADVGIYLLDKTVRPFLYGQFGAGRQLAGAYGVFAEGGAGAEAGRWQMALTYRGAAIKQVNEDRSESPSVEGFYLKLGYHFNR
jgi:hypothetical protein